MVDSECKFWLQIKVKKRLMRHLRVQFLMTSKSLVKQRITLLNSTLCVYILNFLSHALHWEGLRYPIWKTIGTSWPKYSESLPQDDDDHVRQFLSYLLFPNPLQTQVRIVKQLNYKDKKSTLLNSCTGSPVQPLVQIFSFWKWTED